MDSTFATVEAFAAEVERIFKNAQDWVAPSYKISLEDDKFITINGVGDKFPMTEHAENQLASCLNIPKMYWDRCGEVEGLRSFNANMWLASSDKGRMVRTIDGKARAFVSDQFLRIDNFPVLNAIFPVLKSAAETYGLQVISHSLSDTKMYLRVVFPKKVGEIRVGDVVQAGATITNSEVGAGAYDVMRFILRRACTNGMNAESFFRKHHLGRRIEADDEGTGRIAFKADTIASELRTIALQSRDALDDAINGDWFDQEIYKMKEATGDKIEKPTDTIEKTVKLLGLPDFSKDMLIANLVGEGDLSRWGLVNAVTALSHRDEFATPDKSFDIESKGYQILSLSKRDWAVLTA